MGATSAGSVAVSTASLAPGAIRWQPEPVPAVLLARSVVGYSLASGCRHAFGDVIQRPDLRWDGVAVDPGYWRAQPVQPGEVFAVAMTPKPPLP